jgi:hypothetical protein
MLPDDLTSLTDAQASACVRTAALVNGSAALRKLAGYASDPRQLVQRELVESWQYFNPEEYARTVLADAPLENGRAHVQTAATLPHLRHLNRLTRTFVDWKLNQGDTLEALESVLALDFLRVHNGVVNLAPLSHHQALESICTINSDEIEGLDTLQHLESLRRLYLYRKSPWRETPPIPALPKLQVLCLSKLEEISDFTFLQRFPELYSLHLYGCSALTRINNISHLTKIEDLGLIESSVPDVTTAVADSFPLLTSLDLRGNGPFNLAPLVEIPRLHTLRIQSDEPIDLRPLAPLSNQLTVQLWQKDQKLTQGHSMRIR